MLSPVVVAQLGQQDVDDDVSFDSGRAFLSDEIPARASAELRSLGLSLHAPPLIPPTGRERAKKLARLVSSASSSSSSSPSSFEEPEGDERGGGGCFHFIFLLVRERRRRL